MLWIDLEQYIYTLQTFLKILLHITVLDTRHDSLPASCTAADRGAFSDARIRKSMDMVGAPSKTKKIMSAALSNLAFPTGLSGQNRSCVVALSLCSLQPSNLLDVLQNMQLSPGFQAQGRRLREGNRPLLSDVRPKTGS